MPGSNPRLALINQNDANEIWQQWGMRWRGSNIKKPNRIGVECILGKKTPTRNACTPSVADTKAPIPATLAPPALWTTRIGVVKLHSVAISTPRSRWFDRSPPLSHITLRILGHTLVADESLPSQMQAPCSFECIHVLAAL